MLAKSVTALACSLLFVACAGNDEPSTEDVRTGWRSTSLAVSGAMADITIEADAMGEGTAQFSGAAFDCPEGGTVSFDGSFGDIEEFAFDMVFDNCTAGGVSTVGEMSYRASIEISGTEAQSTARIESTYVGQLVWTGAVEGSCTFDAAFLVASSATGATEIEATGQLCGVDAASVLGG